MKLRAPFKVFLAGFLFLSGCTTFIGTNQHYKAPGISKTYNRIILCSQILYWPKRRNMEEEFTKAFASYGITIVKSSDLFPPKTDTANDYSDKDKIIRHLKSANGDALLIIRLTNKWQNRGTTGRGYIFINQSLEKITEAFPPYIEVRPDGNSHPEYIIPTNEPFPDDIYQLEASLYDLKTGLAIWEVESIIYNPGTMHGFVGRYVNSIVRQGTKDRVIGTSK
jgi:hypothetical protein